ncbi:MAG: hypothetical protein ACXWC5_31670, partial [Burkholderiales bacterium]
MSIRSAILVIAVLFVQAASAQQGPKVARIGYLTASHAMDDDPLALAFLRGMEELGYVQGRNIVFETRAAHGRLEQLPDLV